MTQLMPEFERQLRAAARRLIDEAEPRKIPGHSALGGRLVMSLSVAVAIAVALGAVLLAGHRVATIPTRPGAALPQVQYDCAPHQILRPKGRLVATAHGTVDGRAWTLEVDAARSGVAAVQAGRFLFGGHAYGFCTGELDIELINAGAHGIVYGYASRLYRGPVTIEASTHRGTAADPVRASDYPVAIRRTRGIIVYARALPASACAYHGLAVALPQRPAVANATATQLTMTGLFTGACAPGQLRQARQDSSPAAPQTVPPPGLSPQALAQYLSGRSEVGRTGCLACHQIGAQGNSGPGPDLTGVGRVLAPAALNSALVNPTAPMPSFRSIPPRERQAIVAYLHDLR